MAQDETDQTNKASGSAPLLKNPVFLTAVFGAIIAAFANAYVALINNNASIDLESHKEAEEQLIEARKAEFIRLLEVSKLDIDTAKKKIRAFCEMGLITDATICASRENSAAQSGASSTDTEGSAQVTWDSPWVGGGHNQQEICTDGISALNQSGKYDGKTISLQSASEDSRKDFFGHVEYKYHCVYRVSNS